jgi:DNA-binding beta-propeller fold protein YncE
MKRIQALFLLILLTFAVSAGVGAQPVWPPPPDVARVEYVREIRCADLKLGKSLLKSVLRLVSGPSDKGKLHFPFDVVVVGEKLYMTCQEIPALVEVDPAANRFRLLECDRMPFQQPLALCATSKAIYVTDSETGVVYNYIFDDGKVEPLITEGLQRPTGIACVSDPQRLYVVDTGNHRIAVFDMAGRSLGTFGERGPSDMNFNYPTFAAARDSILLINDTLNYRIKLFAEEELLTAIGEEGDGPGTFARPKGVAVDARGNVYVVDGLFDNVQVFDPSGRLLLVIGSAGEDAGRFWSPAGIFIADDLIYIADTFNHRIQILRILGG